ncbi:translation elongation factor, partial [Photobacterium sp. OFAV2-7]|nr:translation elongation factor [Photobacterium sp. OFAV2-7]
EALQRSITALSAMTGHSAASITEECHSLLEKLDWLRVGQEAITYETLSKTIELYNSQQEENHLSIEKLISGLAVRRKVCKLVQEGHINEQVIKALDDMARGV